MSTAVYVVYATRSLDLGWLPDEAPVIVVHNDAALVRDEVNHARVLHLDAPSNIGFGAAVNLALPHVSTSRVVLCNPDLELRREHWDALTAWSNRADVVTVPLVDGDGRPTSVVSRYPTPMSHLASGYRVGRWFPRDSRVRQLGTRALGSWGRAHAESLHSPIGAWPLTERWVSGAVLSVDTDRLRSVGGFDEGYFLYYEDVDLCRRLAGSSPTSRAVVVDVATGVHAVGGSAEARATHVERVRLESAIRYAEAQDGPAWALCERALRTRLRWLR